MEPCQVGATGGCVSSGWGRCGCGHGGETSAGAIVGCHWVVCDGRPGGVAPASVGVITEGGSSV